jgi:hypothetical protein
MCVVPRTSWIDEKQKAAKEGRRMSLMRVGRAQNSGFGSTMQGRGVSSAGRAPALQAGGHRFDPGTLHLLSKRKARD